jgi:hypothetical protein
MEELALEFALACATDATEATDNPGRDAGGGT